ncbi:MAG: DUF4235 domain-containing protein [Actinomycetaceae bacterium]|nr:DUF4235 domain-containing protein [Actinomycetaceae bacterium]
MATNIAWQVAKAGAGLAAGALGTRLSAVAWKAITKKAKPAKNDFNAPIKETIAFAVLSAAVVGVLTTLAERKAAQLLGVNEKA